MTPEKRKPLTRLQFAKLALQQEGRCGCGCGAKLNFDKARQIVDEHLTPLFSGGSNQLENRALYTTACAKEKTRAEAPENARVRRHSGQTSNQVSRRKASGSRFRGSQGFQTNKGGKYKQTIGGRTELR